MQIIFIQGTAQAYGVLILYKIQMALATNGWKRSMLSQTATCWQNTYFRLVISSFLHCRTNYQTRQIFLKQFSNIVEVSQGTTTPFGRAKSDMDRFSGKTKELGPVSIGGGGGGGWIRQCQLLSIRLKHVRIHLNLILTSTSCYIMYCYVLMTRVICRVR